MRGPRRVHLGCALGAAAAAAVGARVLLLEAGPVGTVHGKAPADVRALEEAVWLYASAHEGCFPSSLDDLVEPDASGWRWLEARAVPRDPWGRAYLYAPPIHEHGGPWIGTLGRDARAGGRGTDEDVWNARTPRDAAP